MLGFQPLIFQGVSHFLGKKIHWGMCPLLVKNPRKKITALGKEHHVWEVSLHWNHLVLMSLVSGLHSSLSDHFSINKINEVAIWCNMYIPYAYLYHALMYQPGAIWHCRRLGVYMSTNRTWSLYSWNPPHIFVWKLSRLSTSRRRGMWGKNMKKW